MSSYQRFYEPQTIKSRRKFLRRRRRRSLIMASSFNRTVLTKTQIQQQNQKSFMKIQEN